MMKLSMRRVAESSWRVKDRDDWCVQSVLRNVDGSEAYVRAGWCMKEIQGAQGFRAMSCLRQLVKSETTSRDARSKRMS